MNHTLFDTRELRWQLKCALGYSLRLRKRRRISTDAVLGQFNTAQQQRFAQLQRACHAGDWSGLCNHVEYRENLYLLDLLQRYASPVPQEGKGLDIGCRNFSHLPALSAFMPGAWDGVELDAHARYWNGYTRRALGEWMAKQRVGCRYIAGSLLDVSGQYDVITWTLPFVLPAPLRHWGLPERYFQPAVLLNHANSLLKPGGTMLIINQGEAEAEEQRRLFNEAGIAARELGELDSVFSAFRNPRFGWLVAGY